MANIAIFRINYKSDFILTLNSDAGWMTPFCIKFWTGAPSQAYFAGYDGETYTHCAPVAGDPTKLEVQFDDHHLPIGDLKFQIGYHFTVADFPTTVEDEVINQAAVIIDQDGTPMQVMLDLNGETAPEIEFSLPAYANEAQRIANEEQRIAAEAIRIVNEESRIAAETIRQQNEAQRIAQETARVNEFATLKSQSQAATRDANDAATLANQKAQLAADKAVLADDAATLANQKAQLAADKAALANDAAQLAADKAALAQQKAEYAQQQGDYAKDQGDYAKNQGNYAKEQVEIAQADHQRAEADHGIAADDHTQAGNDHTRAESDHGIAVDDHTQAGNDHTRAESDHGIATDDHTQAGNDHTRAESDHGIAADDHTQAGNDHTRAESDHTRAESDHAAVEVYVDSLGAFDISAYHATGGVLAKYADLTAALGTNGANIPDALRKGGMSVKFVQSSDNKYVKFFCTAQNFTTDVTQWQGVDDEPTAESDNLVKSGGVAKQTDYLQCIVSEHVESLNTFNYQFQNGYIKDFSSDNPTWKISNSVQHVVIPISDFAGKSSVKIVSNKTQSAYIAFLSSYNVVEGGNPNIIDKYILQAGKEQVFDISQNATYLYMYARNGNTYYLPSALILEDDIAINEQNIEVLTQESFPFDNPIKGYISYDSTITFTPYSSNNLLLKIPVVEGKTYILNTSGSLHASPYCIWGTTENNVTGTRFAYSIGENRYTVPTGVHYLWINAVLSNVGSISNFTLIDAVFVDNLRSEIQDIGEDLEALETSFTKEESPNLFDGTLQNGYINPSTGNIDAAYNPIYKVSGLIPVRGNTYYSVTLYQIPTSRVGRALNANNEPLQLYDVNYLPTPKWSYHVTYNETTNRTIIKTPENAVYMQFNLDLNDGIEHPERMMVEEIGSTYNPGSFIPTPYYPQGAYIYNLKEQNLPQEIVEEIKHGGKKVLKVLLIGSSFGMQTIAQFPALAKTGGVDVVAGNLYTGAISLENVANNMLNDTDFTWYAKFDTRTENAHWIKAPEGSRSADYAFADENWDIIIVQRDADNMPYWTQNMSTALNTIIEHIKSECDYNPKIMFNSGFAYPLGSDPIIVTRETQEQRSEDINSTALEMQAEYQLDVIPTCTAIQNARLTSLTAYGTWTDHDLASDYMHLDYGIGCYVAACTMYEFLIGKYFNRSVLTVPYLPTSSNREDTLNSSPTNFTDVTDEMSIIAKYCAMSAVLHPTEFNQTLATKYAV